MLDEYREYLIAEAEEHLRIADEQDALLACNPLNASANAKYHYHKDKAAQLMAQFEDMAHGL